MASFTVATRAKTGDTETGDFALWGGASAYMGAIVNFRIPFAQGFDAAHVHFIAKGAGPTPSCPGHGIGSTGRRLRLRARAVEPQLLRRRLGQDDRALHRLPGADADGFTMGEVAGAAQAWSYGDWAATAP